MVISISSETKAWATRLALLLVLPSWALEKVSDRDEAVRWVLTGKAEEPTPQDAPA